MTHDADELKPGERFATYMVERQLGRGGFGAVYLVENELGMRFALKVLHAAVAANELNRKRFLREMHIAMKVTHESAVPVRHADQWKDRLYYTMDYVQGRPLDEVLQEKPDRRIHPTRAIEWCRQVLHFLEFLHRRGFVHRDLKPPNLMLEVEGGVERIRVLDLGIAKALTPEDGATMLTGGHVIGTPAYMAPEQLCGDAVDCRADLYAVGVILYECLAGCRPFQAPTIQRLMKVVLEESPPPLPDFVPGFPRALSEVIARALAKDREKRFPDAASFLSALAAASRVLPKEWQPEPTVSMEVPGRARPPGGRRILLPTLGGVVLAAMGVAGWMLLDGGTPETGEHPEPMAGEPVDPGSSSDPPRSNAAESSAKTDAHEPVAKPLDAGESAVLPSAPEPPRFEVIEPAPGSPLAGRELGLGLRIQGSGPFSVRQGGVTSPLEERDGLHHGLLTAPEHDGASAVDFEILDQNGARASGAVTVVVDRTAPRVVQIEPASGTRLQAQGTLVTVTADEPLGEGTRIGTGQGTTLEGERASARIEGSGRVVVPLVLFDKLGNRFEDPDHELLFALPPPTVTVLQPRPGTVLAGESVSVRFQVVGQGIYTARVGDLAVQLDEEGTGEAVLPLPEEGLQQVVVSVAERDAPGEGVVEKVEVRVDRTPPEVTGWHFEPAGFVMPGGEVSLAIQTNEELGEGTGLEGIRGATVSGSEVGARFIPERSMSSVHVNLVDRVGNARPLDCPLKLARIPPGLEPLTGSRADLVSGWVTPLLEPRTGIELVLVPPTPAEGFEMGAVPGDNDARADEEPRHRVVLSKPYYMGRTEVTWEQLGAGKALGAFAEPRKVPDEGVVEHWKAEMEGGSVSGTCPCVKVTWKQAGEFCLHLGLQLPTEAQWEWACRQAASTGRYAWGYDFNAGRGWANVADKGSPFGVSKDPPASFTDGHYYAAPAAGFRATELGLVHLTGNVLEWCRDYYDEGCYGRRAEAGAPALDPLVDEWRGQGPAYRVLRGGSFRDGAVECRLTRRFGYDEDGSAFDYIGFRVCLEVELR